jgi:hypothetical protein
MTPALARMPAPNRVAQASAFPVHHRHSERSPRSENPSSMCLVCSDRRLGGLKESSGCRAFVALTKSASAKPFSAILPDLSRNKGLVTPMQSAHTNLQSRNSFNCITSAIFVLFSGPLAAKSREPKPKESKTDPPLNAGRASLAPCIPLQQVARPAHKHSPSRA